MCMFNVEIVGNHSKEHSSKTDLEKSVLLSNWLVLQISLNLRGILFVEWIFSLKL